MSIKQNGVLIAGGGQGGGHAVVSMDGITITNNANHEIQTVAKINQNNASGAVGYLYDWCGTLEEYTTQGIATAHPDWICYITNDAAGGVADVSLRPAGDLSARRGQRQAAGAHQPASGGL